MMTDSYTIGPYHIELSSALIGLRIDSLIRIYSRKSLVPVMTVRYSATNSIDIINSGWGSITTYLSSTAIHIDQTYPDEPYRSSDSDITISRRNRT